MAATEERWLIQEKTGRLYPFRPILAQRKDMRIFDPEKARRRIAVNEEILKEAHVAQSPESQAKYSEDVATMRETAKKLVATENAIDATHEAPAKELGEHAHDPEGPTQEEKEADARKERINKDEQVMAIKGMKTGAEIAKYIRKEFGEDVDARSMEIEELREMALRLRIGRMLEK